MDKTLLAEDQPLINRFPVFLKEDISRVNHLFQHYIFFSSSKNGDRSCEASCCGKEFTMGRLARTMTEAHRAFMGAKHNDRVVCPGCGARATLKNKGTCRGAANLTAWGNVILFHVRGKNEVYAQAYYVRKQYGRGMWRPEVEYMEKAIYLLRPGQSLQWRWEHDYRGYGVTPSGKRIVEGWKRTKTICEPFQTTEMYTGKRVGTKAIGLERLNDSFLAYCQYNHWAKADTQDSEEHFNIMRYLGVAAEKPHIEMLVKMGLGGVVHDLVIGKRKLTREINWAEQDPRKAFGLTGAELNEFIAAEGDMSILRWYKALRRAKVRTSIREIEEVDRHIPHELSDRFFRTCTRGCGIGPEKALRYLQKFCDKNNSLQGVAITWMDYVSAASYCGYAIDDMQVLTPKKLKEAHDSATATETQLRFENETQDEGPYQARYQKLMNKYGYEDDCFFIRAPSSSREIIQEGKLLKHCVGRYTGDHAAGRKTILFMRRKDNPFQCAFTIEMRNKVMVQVQGANKAGKRDPTGEADVFLQQWLAWVKAGCKRNKDGSPRGAKAVIKKKQSNKKEEGHVA